LSGPKNKKKILLFLFSIFALLFLGENNIFENHIDFAFLIKGTALGWAL